MAQWDVYPNPSSRGRDEIPFLVDLQSDVLSALGTRLMAPLARTRLPATGLPRRLCPTFKVQGQVLALIAHEAGPIESRRLSGAVASLRAEAHVITDALDAVIRGI